MRAIAHRGCLTQYPENTLRAFRQSSATVDMIELDVQRCASGELVVFHDETLDRLTDGTGPVAETPYEELRRLSVLESDEHVPQLVDVFEAVPSDVGLNLELKASGVAADTVDVAADYDHEVIFSSFLPGELVAARDAGAAELAFLCYDDTPEDGSSGVADYDVEGALDVATEIGCAYVHPEVDLCLHTDLVRRAHDRGFGVNTWTVVEEATVRELGARGVDGVIIDDCELAETCRNVSSEQ